MDDGYNYAEDLATDPPANLTPAGLSMLREIWMRAKCPSKPEPIDAEDDGTLASHLWVDMDTLDSHHGTDAKRRSAAGIRRRLIAGGYLHLDIEGGEIISYVALSLKAYEALSL